VSAAPGDGVVTLVEYGNYECLHCRRAHPFIEALRAEAGDRLRFVYRHFARPADFPNAELAAEAAEAAGAQGRFWEMHDSLFSGGPRLHRAALADHAAALGLDLAAFDAALRDRTFRDPVREGLAEGLERGVRSTPSFFIDGVLHENAWDLDALRDEVLRTAGVSG
jgi:protein-disulfide isomerase